MKPKRSAVIGKQEPPTAPRSARSALLAPLELRGEHRDLIERAAALRGQQVSAFIAAAAIEHAWTVIRAHERLALSDEARDVLLAALDRNAAAPSQRSGAPLLATDNGSSAEHRWPRERGRRPRLVARTS